MTGGQSDLDFSVSATDQEVKENDPSNQLISELNLKVIELTEEENISHKEYLQRMKEETGTDPLGLN
jgi:alkyl hydroperoxide reductase subunit AhpC